MKRTNAITVFLLLTLLTGTALRAETHGTPGRGQARATAPVADTSQLPVLPSTFRVHQKALTLFSEQFTIKSGAKSYGTLDQKVFSLTTGFTYKDAAGKTQATARAKFFALGSTVEIKDANGKLIGTIQEKIWKSLFKISTEYAILDANGREIATSDKVELFATKFKLKDKTGKVVIEMKRPAFNLISDNWDVTVHDAKAIDPRIVVMIPAYKSTADANRD